MGPRDGDRGFRVYLNDQSGRVAEYSFFPRSDLKRGACFLSRFADIDNDGDQDVIYTDGPDRAVAVGVLVNDGTGRLSAQSTGLAEVTNGRLGIGDLDNDGFVDLVIAGLNEPAQIWMNDGRGGFTDSGVRLGERISSQSLAVGDLDQDGDLDIFITDYRGGNTGIWFNQLNPGPAPGY